MNEAIKPMIGSRKAMRIAPRIHMTGFRPNDDASNPTNATYNTKNKSMSKDDDAAMICSARPRFAELVERMIG